MEQDNTRIRTGAGLEAQNISFAHGATAILDSVSFRIAAGEHVAIIGRSGAGKSTLLHLLAGLLAPRSGSILVGGAPVGRSASRPVLMFQRPALLPWLSVYDNIYLPFRFSGLGRRAPAVVKGRVQDLLEQIGLQDRADALPVNLSGGQQQRVALARALAGNPPVLLLDEPFSALDSETRTALRNDIRKLARVHGTTLVTVTHDLADAAAMADRVLVLSAAAQGPSAISDDFELGPDPERYLRLRLSPVREAA